MEFFNSIISEVISLTDNLPEKSFSYSEEKAWSDIGFNQVILQRDTAFELSGTGFNLVTSSPVKDEIIVVGDDLGEISENRKFARISIVQIENEEDQQKAYNLIRKIEYVKYHYFPDGYMIRTASRSHKEAVRVSKDAVKRGISFDKVGSLLIKKYKENPAVKGIKVIFITADGAPYSHLDNLAHKSNNITETLNHIMNSVNFDCDTCNLKPICDEVEGMKELHFKKQKGM